MTNLHRILAPVAVVGAVVALAGCAPVWAASGPRVTDERDIDAVEAVALRTSGDLTVTLGDTPSLTISAPQGVLDRLTSEIEDGVLVLDLRGPSWGMLGEIDYALTVPRLSDVVIDGSGDVEADFSGAEKVRIEISGSGDVSGTGLDADRIETVIDGSGAIDLEGEAREHRMEISGSGDIDAEELRTRDARILIDGSGDADLQVTGTLDAEISGSGEVRYRGGATVSSDISGSGSVVEG